MAYGARSAAPRLQVGEGEERPVLGAAAFPALALGLAAALLRRPSGGALGASAARPTRRAALLRAAAAAAGAPAFAKDKGYLTLSEYNDLKQKEKKESEFHGQFASLRDRVAQTQEFGKLAADKDFGGVSKLALAWDSTIRQPVLESAAKKLTGKDKDAGLALSKQVLEDLKQLDRAAKAGAEADVVATAATLKGHVLEFVALEPAALQEKFGIGDL